MRALADRAGVPTLPAPARHEVRGARTARRRPARLGPARPLDDRLAVGSDMRLRGALRALAREHPADLLARLGGHGLGVAGQPRVHLVAEAVRGRLYGRGGPP